MEFGSSRDGSGNSPLDPRLVPNEFRSGDPLVFFFGIASIVYREGRGRKESAIENEGAGTRIDNIVYCEKELNVERGRQWRGGGHGRRSEA